MAEQQDLNMLLAPTEDSDSDGGVLLCDFRNAVRDHKHKLSETMANVQFTFTMLLPNAPFPTNLALICAEVKKHPPHDHAISSAHSLAFDASRCYILPENVVGELSEDEELSASDTKITDSLSQVTFSDGADSHSENGDRESSDCENSIRELTSRQIQRALRHWTENDPAFARHCRLRDARNPFPGVDMNIGWNRARCETEMHMRESAGTVEERKAIEEGFQRFSFSRQAEPLVLPKTWEEMFGLVFIGSGHEKSVWSRQPGSWWAARRGVFVVGRGSYFVSGLKWTVKDIVRKVDTWREKAGGIGSEGRNLKREWLMPVDETEDERLSLHAGKKRRASHRKSEEVMSEAWRMRRRLQEKNAGRWMDGKLRMDRLWAGFHWVLNVDDV